MLQQSPVLPLPGPEKLAYTATGTNPAVSSNPRYAVSCDILRGCGTIPRQAHTAWLKLLEEGARGLRTEFP